jgi:FkbM family methyltransferase
MKYEQQIDKLNLLIKRYIHSPIVSIVEVGARDCNETLAFHHFFPQSSIITFECNPTTLPICRKAVSGIQTIKLIEKAVSNREGTMKFNLTPDDPGSSSAFLHQEANTVSIEVPVTTLNKELSVAPTLLWMDAQGSELNVLKGASSFLKDISIINTEVYFVAVYKDQPLYRNIKKLLNENGFKLLSFTGRCKTFGDAVFINSKVYQRKTPQWFSELFYYMSEKITGKIRGLMFHLSQ